MNDNIEKILPIKLHIRAELGGTDMPIGEILALAHGSVITLDTPAGEPLSIYANDRLIARGEAVIVNEKFGIRIIEVTSQEKT